MKSNKNIQFSKSFLKKEIVLSIPVFKFIEGFQFNSFNARSNKGFLCNGSSPGSSL